ncbi:hypothetical protein K7E16_09755, partial [Ligilactobacillus salivarius]|nr:hypothetical protein [Ligilactobacillus salivarius]
IRVMKEYGAGTHEYRALKRFWKLLLKNQDDVDYHRYYPRINFGCIIFRTDNVKFFCITVLLLFSPFLRQNKRDGPQRQSN